MKTRLTLIAETVEDQKELENVLKIQDWMGVLWDLDTELRNVVKYGASSDQKYLSVQAEIGLKDLTDKEEIVKYVQEAVIDEVRVKLHELLLERDLSLQI